MDLHVHSRNIGMSVSWVCRTGRSALRFVDSMVDLTVFGGTEQSLAEMPVFVVRSRTYIWSAMALQGIDFASTVLF